MRCRAWSARTRHGFAKVAGGRSRAVGRTVWLSGTCLESSFGLRMSLSQAGRAPGSFRQYKKSMQQVLDDPPDL